MDTKPAQNGSGQSRVGTQRREPASVFDSALKEGVDRLISNIKSVIYIDTRKLEYIIAAKIAGGHVMLADAHGVGKTSLARALAGSIEWDEGELSQDGVHIEAFNRIQCTVDLLPQDILGFTRLDGSGRQFVFNKGPIFAHFVLCDEINLLTPKTQGSFFQAMQEQTVTIEGKTYHLTDPFFIIATMNLRGAHLFPLPAPQLDRFMVQLSVGYPDPEDEAAIIKQHGRDDAWDNFKPVISSRELLKWQKRVDDVSIHSDIVDYIVECVRQTRYHPDVLMGASPRTGVKVSRLARSLAMIRGSDYVTVDLIKEIFLTAVSHRLVMQDPDQSSNVVLESILDAVPVDAVKRKAFKDRTRDVETETRIASGGTSRPLEQKAALEGTVRYSRSEKSAPDA
jgi:MoxR-like ATPase